jgi:hypothetical protein
VWYRKCPLCNSEVSYENKRSWYNAKANDSMCVECQKVKLSEHFTDRKNPNYPKVRGRKYTESKWKLECPDCGVVRCFASKYGMNVAIRKNTQCESCSHKLVIRGAALGLKGDSLKKMRATKAGFSSWEEYKQKYPMKKSYINEVHNLTRKQPLHTLPNYSKLEENRGRMGVEGAYQIDHIISINKGWKDMIPAEEIANITNLQVMKWEDNLRKH